MQRIKIKLPFKNEGTEERICKLMETAKILSNNLNYTIAEEQHYPEMSFIVIFVNR
jgi:hypothetical protein